MKKIIILSIVFLLITVNAGAETLQLRADYLNWVGNNIELRDNIEIIRDDIRVTALRGKYNRTKKEMDLKEEIIMDYEQGKITSFQLRALLESNLYIFEDEVVFSQIRDNVSFVLKAPFLELDQNQDFFIARQGVSIDYNGRQLQAEEADYQEETATLTLLNNVYIEEENGDWIKGDKAIFYLDEEEETFIVKGKVEVEINIGF